jgi:hypothetical protein
VEEATPAMSITAPGDQGAEMTRLKYSASAPRPRR